MQKAAAQIVATAQEFIYGTSYVMGSCTSLHTTTVHLGAGDTHTVKFTVSPAEMYNTITLE